MSCSGRMLDEPHLSYEEVMEMIDTGEQVLHGYRVKTHSLRYKTFRKSRCCVACGLEGSFFALHKSDCPSEPEDRAHLQFWAALPDGNLRLMTKDHIIPKSRGGGDHLKNMQTMCSRCNTEKGSRSEGQQVEDLLYNLRTVTGAVRRRVLQKLTEMVDAEETGQAAGREVGPDRP